MHRERRVCGGDGRFRFRQDDAAAHHGLHGRPHQRNLPAGRGASGAGVREASLSNPGTEDLLCLSAFCTAGEDCTAAENVALPLLRQRMSGAERRAKVLAALEQVGIADLSHRKPSQLSGGQKQRTAIARAIVCGADILLADEPTGALDSRTGAEIMGVFQELNRMGKTIVIITHDRQVASCANRLIEMQDGRIIHDEAI